MLFYIAIVALLGTSAQALTDVEYEATIQFVGHKNGSLTNPFASTFNKSMTDQGCDPNANFTLIVHGWKEGYTTAWVATMVNNFLKYRGGCVIFVNYTKYSASDDYFGMVSNHFEGIKNLIVKKMKQIGNYDRQLCFGFSFGSRLCIGAGLKLGNQTIGRMELCEPAGPGFDNSVDPKPAAKNVACINTSNDKGTTTYNCHQNFLMGVCASYQIGAGAYPLGSHGLCPYFYNLAFTTNYVPVNVHGCSSAREIKNPPKGLQMGYTADFNRTAFRGDVFVSTARYTPYLVIDKVYENKRPT